MESNLADHEKLAIELLLASIIPVAPPQLNGALHCDRVCRLDPGLLKKERQTAIGGHAI